MAITTNNGLLVALAAAQRALWAKATATTAGAGTLFSLFGTAGTPPAGAKQGSLNGAIPDRTTTGSLYFRDPGSGNTIYVAGADGVGGAQAGALRFYDRLWHNSEIVCNITTDQTITQPALTRSTDGIGVEIWGECWTAWGGTGTVFTVTYANTDGVAGRVATYAWPAGAPTVGQCFRFTLQAGDKGVLSIQKISLTPSTAGAGNLGLFLAKPIVTVPFAASDKINPSPYQLKINQFSASACIAAVLMATNAASGVPMFDLVMPEG